MTLGKQSPPPGDGLERSVYVLPQCPVRADRHSDRDAVADAGRHYQSEAAALDGFHDLLVKAIEQGLNLRFLLSLRQALRHVAEAVEVEGRLVKHLEIGMVTDEAV